MAALQTWWKWRHSLKQIQMARNLDRFAQFEGREEAWSLTLYSAGQSGWPLGSRIPHLPTPPLHWREDRCSCVKLLGVGGTTGGEAANISLRMLTQESLCSSPAGPRSGWIVSDVPSTLKTLQYWSCVCGGVSTLIWVKQQGGPGARRTGL